MLPESIPVEIIKIHFNIFDQFAGPNLYFYVNSSLLVSL